MQDYFLLNLMYDEHHLKSWFWMNFLFHVVTIVIMHDAYFVQGGAYNTMGLSKF